MLDAYRQLTPAPHLAVFGTRLGLSVIDAAGGTGHPGAHGIARLLVGRVVASRDGYAAREVLAHDGCTAILTDDRARELAEILDPWLVAVALSAGRPGGHEPRPFSCASQ
jgi:hypothetical protein